MTNVEKKFEGGRIAAFLGALIAVAAVVVALAPMLMSAPAPEALPAQPVNIPITAEGLDTSTGTPIPVRVMGADANGAEVDTEFKILSDGSGAELAEGEYAVVVTGSPIAADGTVYRTAGAAASATVDANGKLALGNDLVLEPIPALEVTGDQISAAHETVKAVVGEEAAGVLRDAAQKRHDDAVAEEERRNDPVVQAQEQGLQVFTGTVRLYNNPHDVWMELTGADPNHGSSSDSMPLALLVLDGEQPASVDRGMYDGIVDMMLDKIRLASDYSGDLNFWRQYDGQHVTVGVGLLEGMHDVSPYRAYTEDARILK